MVENKKTFDINSQQQHTLLGEKFLKVFYRLIQTVKIHQDNNRLLLESARVFIDTVTELCGDEDCLIVQVSRGRFYLQKQKLLYRRETINLINEVLDFFVRLKLPGLRLYATVKDSPLEHVLALARILNNAKRQDNPLAWLTQQLEDKAFNWVEIVYEMEAGSPEPTTKRRQRARKIYSYALASAKEVARKIASQKQAGISKAKRVVQNMIDLLMEDETLLLEMSTVRDYDDYTYTHSVNVSILSIFLGKHIGLSRISLEQLGLCGLFHDLGKLDIPREILYKPDKLNPQEQAEMEKHPWKSVLHVIKLHTAPDVKPRIILSSFEHHLKYNLSGYPRIHSKKPLSLFARILAIADVFDAITSPRIYRSTALSPDHALGFMLDRTGKDFDPILLKVFVNMLGVYPIGTLLQLDTGEMGLVVNSSGDFTGTRPQIVLLVADGQGGFKKGERVNLAERDPRTGSFQRNIVNSLHPSVYGIQPIEFLI